MKVVFCTPSLNGPTAPYIKSLEDSLPAIEAEGWEHAYSQEIGSPYISHARATMTRKALDSKADVIVYIDYDVSWKPEDMIKLLSCDGPVIAGTYRFKKDEEEYMGQLVSDEEGFPVVREDGCLRTALAPAGFLKVTRECLNIFAKSYPELLFGDPFSPSIDLFNHGARNGVWWGEDYAFCQRWSKIGGEIWTPPNMDIDHHSSDKVFKGNLHKFLLRQPCGSNHKMED